MAHFVLVELQYCYMGLDYNGANYFPVKYAQSSVVLNFLALLGAPIRFCWWINSLRPSDAYMRH